MFPSADFWQQDFFFALWDSFVNVSCPEMEQKNVVTEKTKWGVGWKYEKFLAWGP